MCEVQTEGSAATNLLTIDEVAQMTRLGVPAIRWMVRQNQGLGPLARKPTGRRLVWRERDVIAWIDEQFEQGGDAA